MTDSTELLVHGMMHKPRLRRRELFGLPIWYCGDHPLRGFGDSPQDAYISWEMIKIMVPHEWKMSPR